MSTFNSRFSGRKRVSVGFDRTKEGRTKSDFKSECDVNRIVSRYQKTGQLPSMIKTNAQYGDFSSVPDFQSALNLVHHAHEQFAALPAQVRAECYNDPAVFLDRVQDPEWVSKHGEALTGVKLPPNAPGGDMSEANTPLGGSGGESPKKASKKVEKPVKESTTD